ncbi:magnesium and cobalt transport protein CorA [Kineococcus auxinigenes]|uniref:magnesium and cobalt transport protein CorA n=1 Tax=unclassified Kineococcus TaxID=2621656 RepID=UPI003D7EFFFA
MIVDVATYADGRRGEVQDLGAALGSCLQQVEGFLWLELADPGEEELARVASALDLHPLAVEDALEGHQRPKVEHYGDDLFVVLKTLEYYEDRSAVETGEVMLFVAERFVVSVRRGTAGSLAPVRERLQAEPERLRQGTAAVLHAALEHVVDHYTTVDDELERDVTEMEQRVFSPQRSPDAERIYNLKREVLEARRAAAPLVAPLKQLLERGEAGRLVGGTAVGAGTGGDGRGEQALFELRDVVDTLVRTVEHVEGYDRLLTDILNAHLAQVSVQQNDDSRKISAWAAMFAVPTLIAGVYGMNFEHMPELDWRLGYPMCLLLMVGACVLLHRAFKRSGWL